MTFDLKGIVAVLVVLGSFGLIGIYVLQGRVPDVAILGFCGTSTGMVLGFYFGHLNGSQTALASSAVQLAQQAIEKRAVAQASAPLPVAVVSTQQAPGPPGPPAPTG